MTAPRSCASASIWSAPRGVTPGTCSARVILRSPPARPVTRSPTAACILERRLFESPHDESGGRGDRDDGGRGRGARRWVRGVRGGGGREGGGGDAVAGGVRGAGHAIGRGAKAVQPGA